MLAFLQKDLDCVGRVERLIQVLMIEKHESMRRLLMQNSFPGGDIEEIRRLVQTLMRAYQWALISEDTLVDLVWVSLSGSVSRSSF